MSQPTKQTATQRLASLALGSPLEDFVKERREQGTSWRVVARDLYEATDGQVDVTLESLRQWYPDAKKGSAA